MHKIGQTMSLEEYGYWRGDFLMLPAGNGANEIIITCNNLKDSILIFKQLSIDV